MDVKGLAQKYYPRLWDIDRLKALVAAGKLSEADYKEITGEEYTKERKVGCSCDGDRGICKA